MPRPRTTRTPSSPAATKPMSLKAAQRGLLASLLKDLDPTHHAAFLEVISHTDPYCADQLAPIEHEYHCTARVMAARLCEDGMIGREAKDLAAGMGGCDRRDPGVHQLSR